MEFIMSFKSTLRDIFSKSFVLLEVEGNDIIIKSGTPLYHGTSESFNKDEKTTGGYDRLFWTTEYKNIARSYIPVSDGKVYTQSSFISKPSRNLSIQKIQKQLGIIYDDVEFDSVGQVKSYTQPDIFKQWYDEHRQLYKKFYEIDRQFQEMMKIANDDNQLDKMEDDESNDFFDKLAKLESLKNKLKEEWLESDPEIKQNEYVNKKLEEIGYDGEMFNKYKKDTKWKLRMDRNGLLPASGKISGRLLTVIPKRDMKIFDLTHGGNVEGDLMEPQYHFLKIFRKAEESGYDGVKIADFAQTESHGNVGHTSIGFFKHVLDDLDVTEEESTHPEGDELFEGIQPTSTIRIFRAQPENTDTIRKDDYITLSVKFAVEHAENNHIYEDTPHVVITAVVPRESIRPASNPGEYLSNVDVTGEKIYTSKGYEYEGWDSIKYDKNIRKYMK